jgi:hypothetical protein
MATRTHAVYTIENTVFRITVVNLQTGEKSKEDLGLPTLHYHCTIPCCRNPCSWCETESSSVS